METPEDTWWSDLDSFLLNLSSYKLAAVSICGFLLFLSILSGKTIPTSLRVIRAKKDDDVNEDDDDDGLEKEEEPFCSDMDCVRCNRPNAALVMAFDRIQKRISELMKEPLAEATRKEELETLENMEKTIVNATKEVERKKTGRLYEFPGLVKKSYWDPSTTTALENDIRVLEINVDSIKAEFMNLLANRMALTGWRQNKTSRGKWNIFHIINQGKVIEENARLCPFTFKMVTELDCFLGLENVFANVAFSKLRPGTKIAAHYGPTNIRLRCHLPLKVPNYCHMKVDGEFRCWIEGQCLLFDDFLLHSAQNESEETNDDNVRVVLLLDLWHPNLESSQRIILSDLFDRSCTL